MCVLLHNIAGRNLLRQRGAQALALCDETAIRLAGRVEDDIPRNTREITHKLRGTENRGGHRRLSHVDF